jgi:hypothetical protein
MQKFRKAVQVCLAYAAVVVLVSGYPLTAFAETAVDVTPPTEQTIINPTPKSEPTYTFNPETKHWDSDKWVYNATTGKYEAVPTPTVSVPPLVVESDTPQTHNGSDNGSTTITDTTHATIGNTINSDAATGNATVDSNTKAGDATTGNASAVATLMNTINSSVSASGADFATFVTDVTGDVHGDIMLYPMLIKAMLQAAAQPSDTTVAASTASAITNDINLNATSGAAAVTSNTTAGNATTGTANTVANVMNIINSIIAANQSFIGTINIYGNLDGDILVAPDFLPQLLAASNSGAPSAPTGSLAVSSQDTQSIINNINLNAATGNALVANNTSAGNATTGAAKTNIVLLNLSGHQIVANDSLLVFVNVLGQWVGLIVDAPAGTNAAALGTGVTTNNVTPDLTITADNNSKIINNINLNSQTGDATVADNTHGGNATTGGATASANIANVSGSQLGLTGWFGVLFINVFGSWFGSFGVDTERGNQPQNSGAGTQSSAPTTSSTQPFQFIPSDVKSTISRSAPFSTVLSNDDTTPAVTEETDTQTQGRTAAIATSNTPPSNTPRAPGYVDFLPFATTAFILGLGGLATKNIITLIRGRNRRELLLHR